MDLVALVAPAQQETSAGGELTFSVEIANRGDTFANADVLQSGDHNWIVDQTWKRHSSFPSAFDPQDLDGTNGFSLNGQTSENAGFAVVGLGDVNGDGFDDVLVGAPEARPPGHVGLDGRVYVVFGGQDAIQRPFRLADIDGTNGFVMTGFYGQDQIGRFLGAAGDVNGDGLQDLLIASPFAKPQGLGIGEVYVVFGTRQPQSEVDLSRLGLDADDGFTIVTSRDGDIGRSVAGIGDVNGDGIDDIAVGFGGNPILRDVGEAYVIFGSTSGFDQFVDVASLNGETGFTVRGAFPLDLFGSSIGRGGDVNGDGLDDLVIGAPQAQSSGVAYVLFGRQTFDADIDLGSDEGWNGFAVVGKNGSHLGEQVSGGDDFNGDGIADLLISAPFAAGGGSQNGEVYVLYGSTESFPERISVARLDGSDGVTIRGAREADFLASSIASASDVNGDGIDDFVIASHRADTEGSEDVGAAYVFFGSRTGLPAIVNVDQLDGRNGFTFFGRDNRGNFEDGEMAGFSVSSADINGDGASDILIGSPFARENGTAIDGEVNVVFGRPGRIGNGSIADSVPLTVGETAIYEVMGVLSSSASGIQESTVEVHSSVADAIPDNNVAVLMMLITPDVMVADIDLDGTVGFSDFLILSSNFGRDDEDVKPSDGDLDGDGLVGFSDFLILADDFGARND